MKQKKLIFNFFVNRNWKKLTDSRKRAKLLADKRKDHHPIETLFSKFEVKWKFNHVAKFFFSESSIRLQQRTSSFICLQQTEQIV